MTKLLNEVKGAAQFIKGHTLQPKWFKAVKIFILLGFMAGYVLLFGWRKTIIFLVCFLPLMLLVHLAYRINTHKFTQSWLDFVVVEEDGQLKYQRIGKYYYSAILINVLLSILVSHLLG